MQNQQGALPEIEALEAAAMRAAQAGRDDEATRLWGRILAIDPNHLRTLTALGQRAFRQGDKESARTAFQRIVDLDGSDAQQWIHLALACRNLNDEQAEGERDSSGAEPRSDRARRADSPRQPARAAGQDARGGTRLRGRGDRRAPDRAPASRIAARRFPGAGARGEVPPGHGRVPRSVSRSVSQGFRRRESEAVQRFGRHHGRPEEAIRFAVGRCITIPASPRSNSSTAPNFPGSTRSRPRPDEIRDEFLAVLVADDGLRSLHHLPGRRAAEPVRGAQQLAALERLPPVQDGQADRGECRQVPGHHEAARGRAATRPAGTHAGGDVLAARSRRPGFRRTPA